MSSQEKLHSIRMQIAVRNQPRHAAVLSTLTSLLKDHPYNLGDSQLRELERIDAFVNGSDGLVASPPHDGFLYRLCAVKTLTNHVTWKSRFSSHDVTHKIFERLKTDFDSSSQPWLPLSRYAHGLLSGYRSFTWWTSSAVLTTDVIKGALELGLVRVQVPELAILLRCPAQYARATGISRVPTAIDGFISEVFHPTIDLDSPDCGTTIDLCDGDNLSAGRDEYVLAPIEADQVFFRPIHIDESMRAATVESGPRLWTALEAYHNTL